MEQNRSSYPRLVLKKHSARYVKTITFFTTILYHKNAGRTMLVINRSTRYNDTIGGEVNG